MLIILHSNDVLKDLANRAWFAKERAGLSPVAFKFFYVFFKYFFWVQCGLTFYKSGKYSNNEVK